jgi:hypothetical protein
MRLPYSVFLVLGAAAPARAVLCNCAQFYYRLSENGSTVLLSGLWRPAKAEFTRLAQIWYSCRGLLCVFSFTQMWSKSIKLPMMMMRYKVLQYTAQGQE